ncbi:MAG: VOC family protein [Anaerolineae bacterium]
MTKNVTPFLMFEGDAEAAMNLYVSAFSDATIQHLERFGPDESGAEGSVKMGVLTIGEQRFRCFDSSQPHAFSFTPPFSIFVECESEDELNQLYETLSDGGEVLMPLDNYGFSTRFSWVNDRFGVSWQLNLA